MRCILPKVTTSFTHHSTMLNVIFDKSEKIPEPFKAHKSIRNYCRNNANNIFVISKNFCVNRVCNFYIFLCVVLG